MSTSEPPKTATAPKPRAVRTKQANVVPITKAVDQANAATKAGTVKPRVIAAKPAAGGTVAKTVTAQPAAKAAKGSGAEKPAVAKSGGTLRLKDLTERVEALTGGKKKAVRQTVEAVLTVLGHALMAGDDLNLPPLGRARVSRQRDRVDGEILMVRLKRSTTDPAKSGKAATRKAAKEALAGGQDAR